MSKELDRLAQERDHARQKMEQYQHQLDRYENRLAYTRKGENKKRTHRLITRGAAVESIAPLAQILTEVEFYSFAEKVFALPEVKGFLMEAVNNHNRAEYESGGERA